MKGDELGGSEHIARLCKPSSISPVSGRISAAAFLLRTEPQETYLSVNWLEYFNGASRIEQVNDIKNILAQKLRVPAKAKIAVLNVGEMCGHVQSETKGRHILKVVEEPENVNGVCDKSHCGIYDMRTDNMEIAELIKEKVLEIYDAR